MISPPSSSENVVPAGGAVSSLPFGLGSSAGGSPITDARQQSQALPPIGAGAENQTIHVNSGGNSDHPADAEKINGDSAASLATPNSGMPSLGAAGSSDASSNAAAPGAPNVGMANPAADALARHDYEASKRTVLTLLNQGQLVEGLRELSRWYGNAIVPPEDEPHMVELLSQLAGTVIYSRDPWLGPPYQVRVGDSLESIAQQYQVPWQLLAKINGLQNPNGLLPGEKLKIVHGPFQAQLNVRQGWLALFVDGLYAGRFRVQASGPVTKPEGAYPVAKFSADQNGPSAGVGQAPYISLGGDLHLRVPEDALPPGVTAVRISRQDLDDVFDMLSERSQVTIMR
jgi:LysM repeat protein